MLTNISNYDTFSQSLIVGDNKVRNPNNSIFKTRLAHPSGILIGERL